MVKLRDLAIISIAILILASGCALIGAPQQGDTPENKQAIEHLISKKKYHQALSYLDKMQLDEISVAYTSQHRNITRLIRNLEKEVVKKTTDMTVQGNYAEAIEIVDHALEYIPESKKLLNLSSSFRLEKDKRLSTTRHNLFLSEAEHQISQLEWHEEKALLEKPSAFSRWQMKRRKSSLKSLRPELIECAREALGTQQNDIAERCLHTAAMIYSSATVNRLLSQITSDNDGSSLVPLSEEKKIRPASATAPSFLEMEAKLQKELEEGNLPEASATLAELARFPGKEEQLTRYRQILDDKKNNRIDGLLKDGSDLYRTGKIAQAREAWLKVLELDPNNHTANEKIARADKVLQRIEDLQKSQQKTPSGQ